MTAERTGGVWNIVPTPFLPDGTLDERSLATLANFVLATGVTGMTILAVLGEAAKIGDDERARVIDGILGTTAGRMPVCVGVTHASTDRAVAYAREAERAGAHSVMLAPPPLARPTDAALRRHYLAVTEAITIPVVVQDHPASSGVLMTAEFMAALAEEAPRAGIVKLEDEPSPPKVRKLRELAPGVSILGGLGGAMLLEELAAGADGTMTGFGFPEVLVAIVRRWFAGDADGAALLFDRFATLIRFESQPFASLAIRKLVYQRRGAIAHPTVRQPVGQLAPVTVEALDWLLRRLRLEGPMLEPGALLGDLLRDPVGH
ncbi:MAG: dihydrodipicolinate synthase family protein [Chloroflexi bacterium]|nr:dihydrodipicolinate synthase family protein [Chloroflexota bacterium]